MAQFQSPETYVDGQQVTATRLNNQTNGAVALPGLITDQTNITANTVASGDSVLLYDLSATALREANVSDVLGSNVPVTTSAVTGGANSDVVVTPNDGTIVTGQAYTSADGLTVTVTSTAHGLVVGQVILVASAATGYNGTFLVATVATNSFTYVMTTAATPGSSTLSYTKKGSVRNAGNETVAGSLFVTGSTVLSGATTVSGALTSSGTANFTGALQVNGTVGYVLTEIYEETIPYTLSAASQNNLWTSASFTKPVGEIWVFEFSMQHAGYRGLVYDFGIRYGSQPATTGNFLFIERFNDGSGGSVFTSNTFNGRFVVQSATTMTDTLQLDIVQGTSFSIGADVTNTSFPSATLSPSKLRIYKYKTA